MLKPTKQDIARFMDKVTITEYCWQWAASLDRHGYWHFVYGGKLHRAHRVSYRIFIGETESKLDLDHLCRNRACVNPKHLEQVTRSVNLKRGLLWQSKKVTCPLGHPYDYIDKRGARRCKACLKKIAHKNYLKRKALV